MAISVRILTSQSANSRGCSMSWRQTRIETWSELVEYFDRLYAGKSWDMKHLYRGQSDEDWQLDDSLSRLVEPALATRDRLINLEQIAWREFRGQAHLYMPLGGEPNHESLLDWWSLMQHFGCPTRLLDWTGSPFVAAYFAVVEKPGCDGAVWAFDGEPLLMGEPGTKAGVKAAQVRLHLSKDKASLFWEEKIPSLVLPFRPAKLHSRLAAQRGAFTVCSTPGNHGEWIDNSFADPDHQHCHKIIIPQYLKLDFLRRLMRINVSASSLFPGLDGLGRTTRELLQLSTDELDPF